MKNPPLLDQALCVKYCKYYKPGKEERLQCGGYAVVERLLRDGRSLVFPSPEHKPDSDTVVRLKNVLCITCDFHENDCDFMQDQSAPPCGGFVLLERLIESCVITLDDIRHR